MFEFIVEDGTGKEDSTSFATVELADEFITTFYSLEDPWFDLTTPEKELKLIIATRFINSIIRWESKIVKEEQSLAWPRRQFRDAEGRLIKSDTIPDIVVSSTVEVARESVTGNLDERPVFLESQDFGDTREVYAGTHRDGGNDVVFNVRLNLMRAGYGSSNGTIVNVVRA